MDQAGLSLKDQRDVLKEIGNEYNYELGCKELTKFSRFYSKRAKVDKKIVPTKPPKLETRPKKPFFRKFQKHAPELIASVKKPGQGTPPGRARALQC